MKELLLSKGFIFNDYDYKAGNYYEYEDERANEDTKRVAKIFGFENGGNEEVFLCCDENFTKFEAYSDGKSLKYRKDEFVRLVNRM